MKSTLSLTSLIILLASCKGELPEPDYVFGDSCILDKVNIFAQSSNICDSTATVKQYRFQNKSVFLFDQGSCGNDFIITVLSIDCDTLGYLGGIMGNTRISGQNFYANAVYQTTIWHNQ